MANKNCPHGYYDFEECQELLFCTEDFCLDNICPYAEDEDRQWLKEKEPWLFEEYNNSNIVESKENAVIEDINIEIYTSYFANYKKEDAVSIAFSTPNWFKGEEYKKLAPPKKLLYDYKSGLVDEKKYREIYSKEVLNELNPSEIAKELNNKVILCYEKPEDFCHRRLVAEWLENNLDIKVNEFGVKKIEFVQQTLF
jgi:hypothetical protein